MAKKTSKQAPVNAKQTPRKAGAAKKPAAYDSEGRPTDNHLDQLLKEMTKGPVKERIEQDAVVECPYCGEGFEMRVTSEDEGQSMIHDCAVCCRPIAIHVHAEDGDLHISANRS